MHKLTGDASALLCSLGYRHVIQAWSALRAVRDPRGIAPPDTVWGLQRSAGGESVSVRTQDCRLWRYPRDALRQHVRDPTDRRGAPSVVAPHAVLCAAERHTDGLTASPDLAGWEAPPARDHARWRSHDRLAALALDTQRVRTHLGHTF
jgi:hypothetical protein